MNKPTLPHVIATARQKSGLSLRELAAKSGLHYATIHQIETGYSTEPSFRNVVKIARALGVKLDTLAKCG